MALIEFKNLPDTSTPLNAENLNNNFNELVNGTGWLDLPLASGITQYSTNAQYRCQYRKIGNQVFVRGCIKGVTANNTTIATLPAGYRPTTTARYLCGRRTSESSILAYETDGDIVFVSYTSGTPTSTDFIYIQTSFFVD